jgi:RHS repeat-associated protein
MTTAAISATREVSWRPSSYRGEQYDSDLGLYYLRARYYNPNTGRFLSEDPIGFRAGPNFYAYTYDDPTDYRDPLGKDPVIGAIAGGIMGGAYGAFGGWPRSRF